MSALRMDLNLGIISDVEKKLKKKLLIDYLYSNLKHHNFWAYRYFFCEFLALLNVSGNKKYFGRQRKEKVFGINNVLLILVSAKCILKHKSNQQMFLSTPSQSFKPKSRQQTKLFKHFILQFNFISA